MKILFIAQYNLSKELGGPKVVIELAETLSKLGHHADVVGPLEINKYLIKKRIPIHKTYALNIKNYLNEIAEDYDIIDVDAGHLYKFTKKDKNLPPLVVARSVLFTPHLQKIKWPINKSLKGIISAAIKSVIFGNSKKELIKNFYKSLEIADLINVSNHKDVEQLLEDKFEKEKIIHLPFGLSIDKKESFNKISKLPKTGNQIAFIGTFEYRKGCLDIPKIFPKVKERIPDAHLTLIGAKGLIQSEEEILAFFPKKIQESVSIISTYAESELPEILKPFKIGIFPSYLEGFGFSIIELMASGIPVIAYDAPGPSSILPKNFLVNTGDWNLMSNKIINLLEDSISLDQYKEITLKESTKYIWPTIAQDTIEIYSKELSKFNL